MTCLVIFNPLPLCLIFTRNALGARLYDISSRLAAANGNFSVLKSQPTPEVAAEASYRGTSDFLWSCLLTLLACIYTPIHLNIQPRGTGQ